MDDDELITLHLNPADFKVVDAFTVHGHDFVNDLISVEVAPGYFCDLWVDWDSHGYYALARWVGDDRGYIYSEYGVTSAEVSTEDLWEVEDFATEYYETHPGKFDGV